MVLGFFGAYILFKSFLIIYILGYRKKISVKGIVQKPVSIVIAARNEEKNLPVLIQSIITQNYPLELVEVIIGDDNSTDGTSELLQAYASEFPQIQVYQVKKQLPGLQAKQNVLAQIIPHASHEYILTTDADMILSPDWIRTMAVTLEQYDVVGATSLPTSQTIFASLQTMEWLFNLGIVKLFSDFNIPATIMGNNMAFKKSHYMETGGYQALPFSLTEDVLLFYTLTKKQKKSFYWSYELSTLNHTHPFDSLWAVLQQRKRWASGKLSLHPLLYLALGLYFLVFPACILLTFLNPWAGTIMLTFKFITDFFYLLVQTRLFRKTFLLKYFLIFELYYAILSIILPMFMLIPAPVRWKKRVIK